MREEKSELSNFLQYCLEKYQRGDDGLDLLANALEQELGPISEETQKRVDAGREANSKELKSRILEDADRTEAQFSRLLSEKQPLTKGISVEEMRRTLEESKRVQSDGEGRDPAFEQDERQMSLAPSADFHLYFAKEFASKLDDVVFRFERLGELEYEDVPSSNLRYLLQEAHRCYLHGFEIAAAVMCGAALEQALEQRMPEWESYFSRKPKTDTRGKFQFLIDQARNCAAIGEYERGMGHEVRKLRNDAVHEPKKFYGEPTDERRADERRTVLHKARIVIERLLSPGVEQKDS